MDKKSFEWRSGDRPKLLRIEEDIRLKAENIPLKESYILFDLELETIEREGEKHYVASISFPSYRSVSIELSNKEHLREYESLKDKLKTGSFDVALTSEGLIDLILLK